MAKKARIRVFCPCREIPDGDLKVPITLWKGYSQYMLETLYYCDVCNTIRCPRCVDDEVICRYCPCCLFEVTAASAKTDNNQCMRSSCFQCSQCASGMSVVTMAEDDKTRYKLVCNFCQFTPSVVFDKSMALGRQLNSMRMKQVHSRFQELQKYYHKQASNELTNGAATKPTTFNQVLESKNPQKIEAITYEDNDESVYAKLRKLNCKKTRRCRGCRNVLIKPEPKPTSTKFKVKLLAINYIPSLLLTPHFIEYPDAFTDGHTYTFRLTVTSPLFVKSKISLATTCEDAKHRVTIVTPTFELGSAAELWDEKSLLRGVPLEFIKRQTTASQKVMMEGQRETGIGGGFYERGPNWATVLVEIVPSSNSERLEFAIFTNMSYKQEDEENETSVGVWTTLDLGPTEPNTLSL